MTANRKVVITEFGDVDVLKIVDDIVPHPPAGHIQIAVEYAGFNGADVGMRKGVYPFQKKAPLTPGYCLVGTVRANGEGCTAFQVGDVVGVLTKYDANSELVNQPEKYAVKIPDGVDHVQATAMISDWFAAYGMVKHTAKVTRGQKVFVHGISGAVGCGLMILSKLQGAEVYGTASARNHEDVRAHGATPFAYTDKKWIDAMKGLGGVDVVFDPLGFESFDESYSILSPNGFLVAYGNNKGILENGQVRSPWGPIMKLMAKNLNFMCGKKATFFGISRDQATYKEDIEALLEMVRTGLITAPVKNQWDMEDIKIAHSQWGGGTGIGSLFIKVARD
ncbi:protein indc11 [Annulohypoxylon maeteangense]|uniref:protein indc11 n=1 Tax=Annulohypoxylon maeteangense TaxID=1927788 RepID=UPI002008E6CB|nr:protein indc11 [Annulohypoxylon maeteangense]KAI0886306.1 protein indc11 [Annulohypoxylon maeteangense]